MSGRAWTSQSKSCYAGGDGVMVGSIYLFSVTDKVFLAQPSMYFTTWNGALMQLVAEAAPLQRLCDVHLKHDGGLAPMAV
jgi:hypothetical protein